MSVNILLAVLLTLPTSILFISLGLLFGSILNDKQVGGICGALLTNLTAWLSGAWLDLKLVGGVFKKNSKRASVCPRSRNRKSSVNRQLPRNFTTPTCSFSLRNYVTNFSGNFLFKANRKINFFQIWNYYILA